MPRFRALGSAPDARIDLLGLGDIDLSLLLLAERSHGQAAAIECVGIPLIGPDRRAVVGQRMIVALFALMDIAAIDERLGETAVELDGLVEVPDRAPDLTDGGVGQPPDVEPRRVVRRAMRDFG